MKLKEGWISTSPPTPFLVLIYLVKIKVDQVRTHCLIQYFYMKSTSFLCKILCMYMLVDHVFFRIVLGRSSNVDIQNIKDSVQNVTGKVIHPLCCVLLDFTGWLTNHVFKTLLWF